MKINKSTFISIKNWATLRSYSEETKKQLALLLYKLLHDALFLWVLVFAVFLLFEGLIPGYLSEHLSFTKMIFLLLLQVIAISFIISRHNFACTLTETKSPAKSTLLVFSLLISIALITISLREFASLEIIIITATTFAIFYFFWKIFSED